MLSRTARVTEPLPSDLLPYFPMMRLMPRPSSFHRNESHVYEAYRYSMPMRVTKAIHTEAICAGAMFARTARQELQFQQTGEVRGKSSPPSSAAPAGHLPSHRYLLPTPAQRVTC